ncbi:MAG: hypothetical protein SFU86_08100 [Pirellulaceae bacterium]|nr:hypothetical protein [Pirellulaceae bacterium]
MSSSTPEIAAHKPPACPVCGKASYSRDGIHPQCAVLRADKFGKRKPAPKAGKSAGG